MGIMEGPELNNFRKARVWLLFINIAYPIAYGAILFFTDWQIIRYYGFRMAALFGPIYLIYHFVSGYYLDKNPKYILELSVFLTGIPAILLVDYFGGPFGNVALALYLVVIGAFVYKTIWGIATVSTVLFYFFLQGYLGADTIANNPQGYAIAFASLAAMSLAGLFINRHNQSLEKQEASLKKVADRLTAEKSQDEAVLTAIADGVYAVDRDRNMVLLNKAAQGMIGWSEKDALGIKCKTVMNLKNDKDISVCEKDCPALAVWNTGEPVFRNDTCYIQRKSKQRVQLSSSYAPIKDLEGNMVGAICVFRDVTKEKELERQRNEFVSTASHELRTPITAAEGYISIITDSGMCKVDEPTKEFLGKAKSTLLGMSNLVKNLLAVTKIEEGRLETTVTNFPIKDLVIEVVEVFTKKATEKGIKLEFIQSQDISATGKKAIGRSLNVRADREMLREVLNNLTENAIKFTINGGVRISVDYDDEFATVNIEDTGMGMPKEGQKHLFEKFYRVDNTATREVGGTGLGLYITRSIVETFGGRIWVDSEPKKGSRFHFTIPLALDS
jgi:PAS domain S-box-containing protein